MISLIYPLIIGYCLDVVGFCVIFYLEQRGFIVEIKCRVNRKIQTITIPDDMVFRGNLNLSHMGLTELPDLSAVTVTGHFICSANQLTSLQGAPRSVGGSFVCSFNQLTSLQGAPQSVGGDFYCGFNRLTSLQGAPQSVGGDFDCRHNRRLTSVVGAPQKIGTDFICDDERLKQEYQKMILERKSQDKKCFIKFKNAIAKLLAKKQQLSKPDSGYDI